MRLSALGVLLFAFTTGDCAERGGGDHSGKRRVHVTPDMEEQEGLSLTGEANIYQATSYGNAFLEYHTNSRWDIGLYAFNLTIDGGSADNFEYDTYISLTKWFDVSPAWKLALGTQNGTTLLSSTHSWHSFSFLQNTYRLNDYVNLSAGLYYANRAISVASQPLGAMVGIDLNFMPGVLWAELDFLSGSSNLSGSVVNLFWQAIPKLELYAGIQVPASESGNEFAGNIGFMYSFR